MKSNENKVARTAVVSFIVRYFLRFHPKTFAGLFVGRTPAPSAYMSKAFSATKAYITFTNYNQMIYCTFICQITP